MIAILTGTTCSFNCWYAKEEVCRCSCYGANHGVLLDPANPIPERIVKIKGQQYRLVMIETSYAKGFEAQREVLDRLGWREIDRSRLEPGGVIPYHRPHYVMNGWPSYLQRAADRHYSWPELKAIAPNQTAWLLWLAVDVEPLWCPDHHACPRCIDKQIKLAFADVPDTPLVSPERDDWW